MLIVGSLLARGVAQTNKGILVGVARDASGAVVVNATVTIVGNPRQILWLQLSCWFAVRVTSAASHPLHYSTALRGASTRGQSCGWEISRGARQQDGISPTHWHVILNSGVSAIRNF
jgi:hypothetical protein